jgi:hypothetical protein
LLSATPELVAHRPYLSRWFRVHGSYA